MNCSNSYGLVAKALPCAAVSILRLACSRKRALHVACYMAFSEACETAACLAEILDFFWTADAWAWDVAGLVCDALCLCSLVFLLIQAEADLCGKFIGLLKPDWGDTVGKALLHKF